MRVVAFDPGKNIGYAAIDERGKLDEHGVVELAEVAPMPIRADVVVVGSGTGHKALVALLRERGIEPEVVDETETTREGRYLYFRDHPPKGLLRFLPVGMRVPPRPIDDYAAYAIALRYLASRLRPG